MPTRDEWLALAERCEEAKGPDRELDAALAKASVPHTNGTPHIIMWSVDPDTGRQIPNAFTASLDAAVTVVETEFGNFWSISWVGDEHANELCLAKVMYEKGESYVSPALALMAAYCRARARIMSIFSVCYDGVEWISFV